MKTPQRVVWSEGLLMSPQHLQQQDMYHEQLLAGRLDALEPLNWGVVSVDFDRRALEKGQLSLQEFTGVLPDGLYLSLGSEHAELPASRPVEGHFPPSQSTAEVFLGVPREREGGANYSDDSHPRARFHVERRQVMDRVSNGQHADVPFAKRNVTLLFGDEPRDDFECIKVAEITRDDAGGLIFADSYIPPVLRISASPFITASLRRILGLMGSRQRSLAESRRQRDASTIEFNAQDVTRFLLLNAINTFYPVMNHFLEAGDVSPRHCYLLLTQLAGQLSTFSASEDPATLPKFVYTDLRSTFEDLFARITSMLQATVQEHYVGLTLETRHDGVHYGRLNDEQMLRCDRFLISVESHLEEQRVGSELPRLAKIASFNDLPGILAAATPGVPAEVTYRPPPEIPIKAGQVYFTLSTDNPYWRNIIAERAFSIYLPQPFTPDETRVQLLGIPPAGGGSST